MKWFIRIVLSINLVLVLFIDLIGYTQHVGPVGRVAALEPILSRQYAAVALGYSVIVAFIVFRRCEREPVWLLVPAIILSGLWLDAVYELAVGSGPVSENLPPAVIRALFVASYLAGYFVLRRPSARQAISASPARASS